MPFTFYCGLKMHGSGRQKGDIDEAHTQGISVSYKQVMEGKLSLAQAVCKRHNEDGIVLLTDLHQHSFSTYGVDNLYGQSKGNFSQDEFHGTALSATNHLSCDNLGLRRPQIKVDSDDSSTPKLPDSNRLVKPAELDEGDILAPRSGTGPIRPSHDLVHGAKVKDKSWLLHGKGILDQDTLGEKDVITWSGFNSHLMNDDTVKLRDEIGVYPLFPDKAASASMMKHAMVLAQEGTSFPARLLSLVLINHCMP